MIYLLISNIVSSMLIFLSFYFGLVNGQNLDKGKDLSVSATIKERKEEKKASKEQIRMETIMSNIDAYDGTAEGQKNIPN